MFSLCRWNSHFPISPQLSFLAYTGALVDIFDHLPWVLLVCTCAPVALSEIRADWRWRTPLQEIHSPIRKFPRCSLNPHLIPRLTREDGLDSVTNICAVSWNTEKIPTPELTNECEVPGFFMEMLRWSGDKGDKEDPCGPKFIMKNHKTAYYTPESAVHL